MSSFSVPRPLLRRALAPLLALLWLACGGAPKPVSTCMDLVATQDLNLYDGQAHALSVYVYPLRSTGDFQRLTADEILGGGAGPGMDPPRQLTVGPGQVTPFQDVFPPMTTHVGIVADYYHRMGESQGERKVTVPAECGKFGGTRLTFAANGIQTQ
jgi:type VI secretion system VasD/TssJ family lipoprotein